MALIKYFEWMNEWVLLIHGNFWIHVNAELELGGQSNDGAIIQSTLKVCIKFGVLEICFKYPKKQTQAKMGYFIHIYLPTTHIGKDQWIEICLGRFVEQ